MKYIYEKDFLPALKDLINDLKDIEIQGEMNYIYTILSYIIEAGELDKQEFVKTIKTGLTQVNEVNIMTLAEQFRQEGRQECIALAEQRKKEGLQEGKLEAFKTVTLKLFDQGMTSAQVVNITGLTVQEVEQLKDKNSN